MYFATTAVCDSILGCLGTYRFSEIFLASEVTASTAKTAAKYIDRVMVAELKTDHCSTKMFLILVFIGGKERDKFWGQMIFVYLYITNGEKSLFEKKHREKN